MDNEKPFNSHYWSSTTQKEGARRREAPLKRSKQHHTQEGWEMQHLPNEGAEEAESTTTLEKWGGGRRRGRKEEEAAPPTCFPRTTRQKQAPPWKTKSTSWLDMTPFFVGVCFPKMFSENKESIFKRKKHKQNKNEETRVRKVTSASCCLTRGSKRPKKFSNPIPDRKYDMFQNSDNYFLFRKKFCGSIIVQVFEGSNICFSNFFQTQKNQTVTPLPTSMKPNLNDEKVQVENLEFKNMIVFRDCSCNLNFFKIKFENPNRWL